MVQLLTSVMPDQARGVEGLVQWAEPNRVLGQMDNAWADMLEWACVVVWLNPNTKWPS